MQRIGVISRSFCFANFGKLIDCIRKEEYNKHEGDYMKLKKLLKFLIAVGLLALVAFTADMATLPIPQKPYEAVNMTNGIHIYWKAVKGTEKYGVWRSETGINGSYTWLGNPTDTHFLDKNVESGKTYYYKVTTLDTESNTHSIKSRAIGITYVTAPAITSRINRSAGISISWTPVEGAAGYVVFRQGGVDEGEWTKVASISKPDSNSWCDKATADADGEVYKYTVCALNEEGIQSGCSAGRTAVRLTTRMLNSAKKVDDTSVECSWDTSDWATGYEVRFMVGDDVFSIFNVDDHTVGDAVFKDLEAEQTYKIQVRSYRDVEGIGVFYSAWSPEKNVTT